MLVGPALLCRRFALAPVMLLAPLAVATSASIAYHQAGAVQARYVVALSRLSEAMSRLDGRMARLDAGLDVEAADVSRTYLAALGLYGVLRAADPDGDEVLEETGAEGHRELARRSSSAAIDPVAQSRQLGLLGNEMPESLEAMWEADEGWEGAGEEDASLEASFGAILLAAAPVALDDLAPAERRESIEAYWVASAALGEDELSEVAETLRLEAQASSRMPVVLASAVLAIAVAAAAFAYALVFRPLGREILRTQDDLAREAVAARAADRASPSSSPR